MLTRLALMFVLHVLALGILFGRRLDVLRLPRLGKVFAYLLVFYVAWGLLFAAFPGLIAPELVNP